MENKRRILTQPRAVTRRRGKRPAAAAVPISPADTELGDREAGPSGVKRVCEKNSTSCQSKTGEEMDPRFIAMCRNSLIAEKISSYLSVDDIKTGSEVSKEFCRMFRGTVRFQKNMVLVISKNAKRLGTMLKKSDFPWRGVRIDMTISAKLLEGPYIQRVLESCEFVSLVPMCDLRGGHPNSKLLNVFLNVLKFSPRLTHLQLDVRFLQRKFSEEFPPAQVTLALQNLKRLDFLHWNHKEAKFQKDIKRSLVCRHKEGGSFLSTWLDKVVDGEPLKMINFLQLAHSTNCLESFRIAELATKPDIGTAISLNRFITPILVNNAASLVELSLHRGPWAIPEMQALDFPKLRRLTATIRLSDQKIVSYFIGRHPLLEEMDLRLLELMDKKMLEAIKTQSPRLKKLHLTFTRADGRIDWNFLGLMSKLKDFSLSRPRTISGNCQHFGSGPRILASLPKNQLEKLSLKGICRDGFWIDEDAPAGHDFQSKTELLEGFVGLRKLSLMRCSEALDDDVLQFIIRRFSCLQEFEVSHCSRLTAKGFTGEGLDLFGDPVAATGVSIGSLTGLTHLLIRGCESLFGEELLSSLRVPSLESFDFVGFPQSHDVDQTMLVSFALRHRLLRTLSANLDDQKSDLAIENSMKSFNHRLRRFVNISHKWTGRDSDSDSEYPEDLRYGRPGPFRRVFMVANFLDEDSDEDFWGPGDRDMAIGPRFGNHFF